MGAQHFESVNPSKPNRKVDVCVRVFIVQSVSNLLNKVTLIRQPLDQCNNLDSTAFAIQVCMFVCIQNPFNQANNNSIKLETK